MMWIIINQAQKKEENSMTVKKRANNMTPLYRTYSLLDKGNPNPITNVVGPSEEMIEFAKHTVDDNEK